MRPSRSSALALVIAACGGAQKPAGPPPCPPHGALTVASQDEVDALAACTELARLTIRTGAALDLAPLAQLERVTDTLVIGPTLALDGLALPALREVGDLAIQSNAALHGVFVPQLAAAKSVAVAGNAQLTTISLPRLTRVAGSLRIEDNGSVEIVDLTALQTVDSLGIVNNPVLATVELSPSLQATTRVIEGNRALGELQPVVPTQDGGDHE